MSVPARSTASEYRGRHLVGAGDDGRDEEHDQRIEPLVLEQGRITRLEGRCGGGAEQVDRIREAASSRQQLPQRARVLSLKLGSSSPAASQRVGAEDSEPAGVREHARRAARAAAGWPERSAAASTSLLRACRARITPACRKSASTAVSEPASAAV